MYDFQIDTTGVSIRRLMGSTGGFPIVSPLSSFGEFGFLTLLLTGPQSRLTLHL